jgi:hypothetical protein
MKELKEFLLKRRDEEKAGMESRLIAANGYFDVQDCSGGNFDDCYQLGKDVGEAELIEEILPFVENEKYNYDMEKAWYDYRAEHPNSVGKLMEYYKVFIYAFNKGVENRH